MMAGNPRFLEEGKFYDAVGMVPKNGYPTVTKTTDNLGETTSSFPEVVGCLHYADEDAGEAEEHWR